MKGTSWSTKRSQVGFDYPGNRCMSVNTRVTVADNSATVAKKRLCVPVLRVCCQRRSVGFNSGQYAGNWWTSSQCRLGFEPIPDIFIFVIRSIVLNQYCAATSIVVSDAFEESPVSAGIEHGILSVMKTSTPKLNRAKDLHVLALSGNWNFGGTTDPAPSCV